MPKCQLFSLPLSSYVRVCDRDLALRHKFYALNIFYFLYTIDFKVRILANVEEQGEMLHNVFYNVCYS